MQEHNPTSSNKMQKILPHVFKINRCGKHGLLYMDTKDVCHIEEMGTLRISCHRNQLLYYMNKFEISFDRLRLGFYKDGLYVKDNYTKLLLTTSVEHAKRFGRAGISQFINWALEREFNILGASIVLIGERRIYELEKINIKSYPCFTILRNPERKLE